MLLFGMGAAGLGSMIKFIPYPVTTGFTSGIAVLIFSTQIKDFFGLTVDKMPSEFFEKLRVLFENIGTIQWPTVLVAATSLAVIKFWPGNWQRRVPGSIVVLVLAHAGDGCSCRCACPRLVPFLAAFRPACPSRIYQSFPGKYLQHLFHPAITISFASGHRIVALLRWCWRTV